MLLPPRPLRLKTSFVWKSWLFGGALLLAGVGLLVGTSGWFYDEAGKIVAQGRIWEHGVSTSRGFVDGTVRSEKFIFHSYKLDVRYRDRFGHDYVGKLEFDTLFATADDKEAPEVRFLPEDPTQFAVSWAVNAAPFQWAYFASTVLVVVFMGGMMACLGFILLRRFWDANRCAQFSKEIFPIITKVEELTHRGEPSGTVYHFAWQGEGGEVLKGSVNLGRKLGPLFADAERRTIVALLAPDSPKRPVVLREDFHPFAFSAHELDAMLSRLPEVQPNVE